jgi:hypothetical protein
MSPLLCSTDPLDACFGAIGAWEEVEARTAAGGANPPFSPLLVRKVISTFDAGVHSGSPYCRCVILPLGKKYGVMKHLTDCITSAGLLLATLPQDSLPFKRQLSLLSLGTVHPRPHSWQALGLLIWVNNEFYSIESNGPPADVEATYLR